MRNVNMAHGSLYLFGAYVGYEVATRSDFWLLGIAAGILTTAVLGLAMQIFVFRRLEGDDLRQTLVTIGISIVAADLMLAAWGGGDLSGNAARRTERRDHASDRDRVHVVWSGGVPALSALSIGRAGRRGRGRRRCCGCCSTERASA